MTYENIAAVWLKKDKNNKTYLSFKAERDIKKGDSIALFRNDKGDNPSRPDFRAYEKIDDGSSEEYRDPAPKHSVSDDIPF